MFSFDIIVPVYNSKQYIEKLLDSFQKQKYENFRLIIVDDGSTDGTDDILKDLISEYSYNIYLIKQKNSGPGIARRTGFLASDADYIMFCDSDDYLSDNALISINQKLEQLNIDILEFGYQRISPDGKLLPSLELYEESLTNKILEHYLKQKNTTFFLCNKVFRRSVIHVSDFVKLYYSEDQVVLANIFSRCSNYAIISEKFYYYLIHKESACGQKYSLRRLDCIEAAEKIYEIVSEKEKKLAPLSAFNVCLTIENIYAHLHYEKLISKGLKKKLRLKFFRYFKIALSDIPQILKNRTKKQFISLFLFYISPSLYSYVLLIKDRLPSIKIPKETDEKNIISNFMG